MDMRNRGVFFAVLLIAIAILSALIGLVIGRSGGQRGQELMEQTVAGEEVARRGDSEIIRFYPGSRISPNILAWVEGNRSQRLWVAPGHRARNPIVFSIYPTRGGARIHEGGNLAGEIKFTLEGGTAYAGPNNQAPAAWSLCGAGNNSICLGKNEQGPRQYTISRDRVIEGPNITGDIIMNADENFENDPLIKLIVPIIEQRLWEQW